MINNLWPLLKAILMKVKKVAYLLLGVVDHVIVSGYSLCLRSGTLSH